MAGFVRDVRVRSGDRVRPGQVLVVLENPELRQQLRELELERRQSEMRRRSYYRQKNVAALQAEASVQKGLVCRETECRQQAASLVVRAPAGGEILAADLDSLIDRFLPEGSELLQIIKPHDLELYVSIPQDQQSHFTECVGQTVQFCPHARPAMSVDVQLDRVDPAAA